MKRKQILATNKRIIQNRLPIDNLSQISAEYVEYHYKKLAHLQISSTLPKVFGNKPMITYKEIKNIDDLIGVNTLQGGKVFKANLQIINGE